MINVNKVHLPTKAMYEKYLDRIWQTHWVTNQGPLLSELEKKIAAYLNTPYTQIVSNGTIAIQLAIRALDLKGEVITTPYSYVATTGSLLWENCEPVFCDVNQTDLCINADLIEAKITPQTTGILATHVYGLPCDVEKIEAIAKKHNLKVIYDAAHAFGCTYKGKSLLSYGDVITCSLHATKIFHCGEGGLVITQNQAMHDHVVLLKSFGHKGDDHIMLGFNGKNSDLHAAMGLCLIDGMPENIAKRKQLYDAYRQQLASVPLSYPQLPGNFEYNYAYFPVFFESEKVMLEVREMLTANQVNTRRYFYPSLNKLPYLHRTDSCPVSESTAVRALCLPFYYDLTLSEVEFISGLISRHFATNGSR